MRIAKLAAFGLLAASLTASAGCVLIGPAGVRHDVTQATGLDLDREFGFRLGRLSLFLVRQGVRAADDEVTLDGVRKVAIGVYQARDLPGDRALCRAELSGWEPVVRVCDQDESVLMFARESDGRLRGMLIVAQDGDEVVIVRAKGRLDNLVASVMELAGDEMRDGRHGEVEVCGDEPTEGCVDRDAARTRVLDVADSLGA